MSRWSISTLSSLTEQQIFEAAAYHMLAHGGAPRELFLKEESKQFNKHRAWASLVRYGRAPKHASTVIGELERIHREDAPDTWVAGIVAVARKHKLHVPN